MTQRISIQYSIDIDELDGEVKRLLDKSFNELNKLSTKTIPNRLSVRALEDIDEARLKLASIDSTLQDLSAIITGYVNYKTSQASPQPQQETIGEEVEQEEAVDYETNSKIEYSF
jgi:hypothetical protein